eukprot:1157231-Pelagomonas_calceolata.AAC.2
MFFTLYVTRITGITDWRGTIGPNSLFNSKRVNSQPEAGNVVKDMTGKIQVHVFRQSIRRVNGMSSFDRKCTPLMICQPLTVVYFGIRSCPSVPDHPAQSRGVMSNKSQLWS